MLPFKLKTRIETSAGGCVIERGLKKAENTQIKAPQQLLSCGNQRIFKKKRVGSLYPKGYVADILTVVSGWNLKR